MSLDMEPHHVCGKALPIIPKTYGQGTARLTPACAGNAPILRPLAACRVQPPGMEGGAGVFPRETDQLLSRVVC